MSRYQVAVELVAEYGVAIFPCKPDKEPRTVNGFKNASLNLEQVDAWFQDSDSLIGVPTGKQFFVVDIDPDGADWYAANAERLACGCINRTRRGWHLAYSVPAGVTIRNSAGKIAPGVDVRGTGGYVIWWPAEGLPATGTLADIGPPPEWLLEMILGKPRKGNGQDDDEHHAGAAIPTGQRNNTLTKLAGKLRRAGLSQNEIEAVLLAANRERCRPPLPDNEVQTIARSVGRYAPGEDAGKPLPRHWIDWPALAGRMPPARTWRISGWITTGPMLLAGRGGIGKTLLAQQLGSALALGGHFLDEVPDKARVLMWACEDDHNELWRRQLDICRWLAIDIAQLKGRFTLEPRLGLDNTLLATAYGNPTWTMLRDHLTEQVNDLAADILILDNIGQTFGCSENDRHAVTAFVNGLLGIRRDHPFTVMLLGHPAKAQGSEFSGSTAWENAVRMRWYLGPTLPDRPAAENDVEADPTVRYLAKRKANYSAQDWRKLVYRDGVLTPEHTGDGYRYDASARREIVQAIVLKGLRRLIGMKIDTSASRNSPNYLPRRLTDMQFAEDANLAEMTPALNSLLADGKVILDDIKGADRHVRRVLRPADDAASACGK